MRALDAAERAVLMSFTASGPGEHDVPVEGLDMSAVERLAGRGCLAPVPVPSRALPPDRTWLVSYTITALGLLALRVSLPTPAVPL